VSPRTTRSAVRVGVTAVVLTVAVLSADALTARTTDAAAAESVACTADVRSIGSVQGSGETSRLRGDVVTVAGTVVGDLRDGGFDGLVVQDGGDSDRATSDGVFVSAPDAARLRLGDQVVVRGKVSEDEGLTQLTATTVTDCGPGELPAATALPLPASESAREAREGMLVEPPGSLRVTDVHELGRYGQVMLAAGGPLTAPTEAAEPGRAARAVAERNAARSLVLDDGRATDPDTVAAEAPAYLTAKDPVRVGDTAVLGQPVVLLHTSGDWLLEPADGTAEGTTFTATNPRPAAPPAVGGDLRIADFNVRNYFVDFPSEFGDDVRGATTTAELARQQAKIVSAITALDADVLTLHEIGNSAVLTPETPYRALETLLAAVDAADRDHRWAHVRAHDPSDVITNAIVYRTGVVAPVGRPRLPADLTAFDNGRVPIAQTFRAQGELLTVIANHLKSKSGACGARRDDPGPGGAGSCNGDREAQARALVAFAEDVASDAGDPDVLLTGDFNAFRYEDPVDTVTAAGYTDLGPLLAPGQHSFVFDGGSGSLDRVFASPSMTEKVTGMAVWDVNAAESDAYRFDGWARLYAADPYRSSDHDPTVVGVLTGPPATASIADLLRLLVLAAGR
jgi:5'-nucleotidase